MGYRPQYRSVEIEVPADTSPPAEGHEPLRVTIRTNLTRADLKRLKAHPKGDTDLDTLQALYAPFVVAWNWEGTPAPADGGPAQFDLLPINVALWMVAETSKHIRAEVEAFNQAARQRAEASVPKAVTPAKTAC